MSDISHFFSPVFPENFDLPANLHDQQFAKLINIHTTEGFPDLQGVNIALIGVLEDRNGSENAGSHLAADAVRKYLYRLYGGSFNPNIADLGNIAPGHSTEDTYFALRSTMDVLIRQNIVPIIIGELRT